MKKSIVIDCVLNRCYPHPKPFLRSKTAFQFLVAVILSSRCTDVRVNQVTEKLFRDYPNPEQIIQIGVRGLATKIHSCGFFRTKARNIIAATKIILEQYQGKVPQNMQELITLPGVGEKTAGVVLSQVFGTPAFPVDTHVFRVARRLGLSSQKTPEKVSCDLKKIFQKKRWKDLSMQFILHGRTLCFSKNPKCSQCPIFSVCPYGKSHSAQNW